MTRARVAGLAVVAALAALLVGGCELREGVSSEYGGIGRNSISTHTSLGEYG